MRIVKIAGVVLLTYVATVVAFESFIGFFQPRPTSTIVISTTDEAGSSQDRVVSLLHSGVHLYVAANHWPRSWYKRARANPQVQVTIDGEKKPYLAVPVTGAEHDSVESEHGHSIGFRILTGFPPRYFLRLDPR